MTTRKSRSGPTQTAEQRAANGWASPILVRMRQTEVVSLDSLLMPGETRQAAIRRIIAEFVARSEARRNRLAKVK